MGVATLVILSLVVSSIGFHRFVWFISLGYGLSIAAGGMLLLAWFHASLGPASVLMCLLLMAYGPRLAIYLLVRERRSAAYRHVAATQVNDGSDLGLPIQMVIWVACAVMCACQASPVLSRLQAGSPADAPSLVGLALMCGGIVLESIADLQKSVQKRTRPGRFCDRGPYSFVRCPNYLGEVLMWTGVFVSGAAVYADVSQWACALVGYVAIVYVMFGGARRLELRQGRSYGGDPAYQAYVRSTPILLPFVPLYSVRGATGLKG